MPGIAFLTLVAFFAPGTVGTVFADNLAEVGVVAVGIGDDKLAVCVDRYLCNADAVCAVYAVFPVLSCVAFFTLVALVAFFALSAVGTVFADNLAEVGVVAVGIGDDKLAVCVDCHLGNADAVFAVFSVLPSVTFLALLACFTLCTVGALDAAEIQVGSVCQLYIQFAVCNGNGFNADAVFAVLAVDTVDTISSVLPGIAFLALFACVAFFSFGADNHAEIGDGIVRIGQNQFAEAIDFRFFDTDAVDAFFTDIAFFTLFSGIAFLALFACVAFFSFGADHAADIGTLPVGKSQDQLALGIDFSRDHTDSVFPVFSVCAVLTGFAPLSLGAVRTDNAPQVSV